MKRHAFVCLLYWTFTVSTLAYSCYYIYPIASFNGGSSIFFIKQQSSEHVQLLRWDREAKQLQEELWSLWNPASVQLLPDESGFSFIDNGRLRIKYFNKRSPKTVDFDDYFYTFQSLQWISPQEYLFSAKAIDDYYKVMHGTIEGVTEYLVEEPMCHSRYPQKVGDMLFFIKQTLDNTYSIMQASYTHSCSSPEMIVDFEHDPIIFLRMISQNLGYVLHYIPYCDSKDAAIRFHYYTINKIGSGWQKKHLFSFSIPSDLLLLQSEDRLYESLLPLLPKVDGSSIYFVDSSQHPDNCLEPYLYNLEMLTIEKVVITKDRRYKNFFVPLPIDSSNLIFGGEIE